MVGNTGCHECTSSRAAHPVTAAPLFFLILLCLSVTAWAQAQDMAAEYQLKAAFLFKFPLYIDWPAQTFNADTQFVFGILGSEPMFDALQALTAGREINGHRVSVVRLQPDAAPATLHVLFIGRDLDGDATPFLQQAVSASILTVTETDPPILAAGMINLEVSEDRIRFDVALAPARAAGLTFSSRLLQVAQKVSETR